MVMQFKVSGTVLFKASGSVAMDVDCCCSTASCCPGITPVPLFITWGPETFDSGETCDAACLPSVVSLGGDVDLEETVSGSPAVIWYEGTVSPGTWCFTTIICYGGLFYINEQNVIVVDGDGATICTFEAAWTDNLFPMTGMTCDPFYWEGDLPFTVLDSTGTPCGTATLHCVITE